MKLATELQEIHEMDYWNDTKLHAICLYFYDICNDNSTLFLE